MREWIDLFEGRLEYVGNCTNAHMADGLSDMMDNAVEVSYRTLVAAVGRDALAEAFPQFDWSSRPRDLTMKDDYAVSYYRSTFKGKPCYYVRESGIEHVFMDHDDSDDEPHDGETLLITGDGAILPVTNSGGAIFSVRLAGNGRADVSQSTAATRAAAQALIKWLTDNKVAFVVEDGDEQPVEDVVNWLESVDA